MRQSDAPAIAPVKSTSTSIGDSGSGLCGLGFRARDDMARGFRRGMAAKLPMMTDRDELRRHLTIFAVTAPSAAIVWLIFHAVYENLTVSAKAVGYVDSMTQAGIDFGYLVMIVGTVLLALVAMRSAFICVRLLLRHQR